MKITLRAARVNRGLTADEASRLLGVSRSTLGKYEKGVTFPDVPTLKKIESVYNVSYNDIIFLPQDYA